MKSEKFSLKSRLTSFKYALTGIFHLFKHEHNSRIHLMAAILALSAGILLKISVFEWISLTIVIGFVFLAELFNSSIESLSDYTEPGSNSRIRMTKDYAAAAVLIAACTALISGGLIFIPKIVSLF